MRWLTLAVVSFLLLAGCSDGHKDKATDVVLGILHGVVVDDALRPLAGAKVTAQGPSGPWNGTSDPQGLFRFEGLTPGAYVVEASLPFHVAQRQAVDVRAGESDPPVIRFQLTFLASSLPYANVYALDGFYECGLYVVNLCSNVNIATGIVLCANTGVCPGNLTADRSVLLQPIDPGVGFLQAELVWQPTLPSGQTLMMTIGGANEAERQSGFAAPYNSTNGPSPLVLRLGNAEGDGAWCRRVLDPPCGPRALEESGIGQDRDLVAQVSGGPAAAVAPSCGAPPAYFEPCGTGFAAEQPFRLITTAFYGYLPPDGWLFAATGAVPPPSA